MDHESVVSSRSDREIRKKIIRPGDYNLVPFEDSRCKIVLSNVKCTNESGQCSIEQESVLFSKTFDGCVLIGDTDFFIDKDIELVLQQMCCGETSSVTLTYKNSEGCLVKRICCEIELKEVTDEHLICDWSWNRLHEAAINHKEHGVQLVKEKRIPEAFRRFSKAVKFLIAIEPIDPEKIEEDQVKELVDLRVKLYNNLAHCQLHYNEHEAAIELCNLALKHDPNNLKAHYRRCCAHIGLNMFEEAWKDIQTVLKADPNDKAAQQKAAIIKPKIEKINEEYTNVMKKMFK